MPLQRHDPLAVPKPRPGYAYRWLADDPERLSMHLLSHGDDQPGYRIVQGKNVPETKTLAGALGLSEPYVNELTNRIQFGRLILAEIPAQALKDHMREMKQDTLDSLGRKEDEFREVADRAGVKPVIAEFDEIQDRKKFATRDSNHRTFVQRRVEKTLAAAEAEDQKE